MDTGTEFTDSFEELIDLVRSRLLPALWSKWGVEVGGDICCEVEEYAWENRDRLLRMSNPLGFLYRVSQSRARRYSRWTKRTTFPSRFPDLVHEDPRLHDILQMLAVLTPDQRTCVLLVHGFGWTYNEVAELLGIRRTEVNNHVHRGLLRLRADVASDPLLVARRAPTFEQENIA
jgi:DNA-directed RNA polymerase specialized sigma24 family protein